MIITALLVGGLVALVVGAELLIRGASRLAALMQISPLVIGLTVVAYGTSMPELSVSVISGLQGKGAIALGNVVGSNICNVLLILGVSAAIIPLVVARQLVRFDVPLMIGLSMLVLALGWDGSIGRLDGGLLFAGLLSYTGWSIWQSRRESLSIQQEYAKAVGAPPQKTTGSILRDAALVIAGLLALIGGSQAFVTGAVNIARLIGMSELVIGLTIVAFGTSLPEIATSILAAFRGQREIAVGNAIGSNLFNILGVLGVVGLVSPEGIPVDAAALEFDLPIMIVVAVACLPVFFTGHRISRWEGGLFLVYYIAYVSFLILNTTDHAALPAFQTAMFGFVIPLTVLTIATASWRALARSKTV